MSTTTDVPAVELLRAMTSLFRSASDLPSLERTLPDVAQLVELDALGAVLPGASPRDVVVIAFGATTSTVEATAAHLVPGPTSSETLERAEAPPLLQRVWASEGFHHGLSMVASYPGGPDARFVGLRREKTWPSREAVRAAFEAAGLGVAEVLERMTRRSRAATRTRGEDTAWLHVVLASIEAPLVLVDVHGVVRATNRAALHLIDRHEDETLGVRVSTLWNESAMPVSFSPESPGWNLTAELRGGRRVEVQSHVLFGPSGAIEGALLELQPAEVMERRRAAQCRAARLQTLGAMTATVAHDLNNLLLPLITSSNLLEGSASEAERREDAALLTDSAMRAAAMVRELLDFGRGTPSPIAPCDVPAVVQRTHKLIRRSLPAGISLVMELQQVPLAHCSETDLVRALVNLCMNARYAMDGTGNLVLRVHEVLLDTAEPGAWKPITAGQWVVLEVQDTGGGIEPSRMASLFQPYETTRFSSGGTGLGLAMVREVLERCGGGAQVSSRVGSGTTMRLFLKRAELTPKPTPPAAAGR
ncbi:MAG: HAMP domain-containing sensor histidine kinase [Myxococcaceae bacterium]|nr:HAMP domain-containing sensor histidine kinase [Myxococcaceae bacterium]